MPNRNPLTDPRPGDVVRPKTGFKSPCLVVRVVDTIGWHSVYCCQAFMDEPLEVSFEKFVEWMVDAEVLHVVE